MQVEFQPAYFITTNNIGSKKMAEQKIKNFKVLQAILHKGKHFKPGITIDKKDIDEKTIARLESAEYLKEIKGFPAIPEKADANILQKLIASLTEQAKVVRQKAKKEAGKLRKKEQYGLAHTKEQLAKEAYADTLAYIEEVKKLHAVKVREEGE